MDVVICCTADSENYCTGDSVRVFAEAPRIYHLASTYIMDNMQWPASIFHILQASNLQIVLCCNLHQYGASSQLPAGHICGGASHCRYRTVIVTVRCCDSNTGHDIILRRLRFGSKYHVTWGRPPAKISEHDLVASSSLFFPFDLTQTCSPPSNALLDLVISLLLPNPKLHSSLGTSHSDHRELQHLRPLFSLSFPPPPRFPFTHRRSLYICWLPAFRLSCRLLPLPAAATPSNSASANNNHNCKRKIESTISFS